MSTLARFALSMLALVVLGYCVAAASGNTVVLPADEPGVAGKTPIQFALAFALVLGWAVGSGLERVWQRESASWGDVLGEFIGRGLVGFVLFFAVVVVALGFEALGVGLG